MGVVKLRPTQEHVAIDVLFTDTRSTYFPFEKAAWVMRTLGHHFSNPVEAFAHEATEPQALVLGFGDELMASMLLVVPNGWSAEKFIDTVQFRWWEIFTQRNDVLIEEGCEIEEEGGIAKAYPVTPGDWASSFDERRGVFIILFCDDEALDQKLSASTGRRRKIWAQLPA